LGTWCLTGFEAAADLAEETKAPTKTIPKAIMLSIITSSITGLLIIIFLVLQANDIEKTKDNLLLAILTKAIGVKMTSTLLIFILISIFACAVASMATASRLLFSFSRDKIFPYSDWISAVGKKSKSPNNAILIIWIFSCLSILGLKRIEIISSVSALAAYLGYTGIMIAALKNKSTVLNDRRFYNKNYWLKAIQWIALCWVVFVVIMLAYPESNVEGFETKHLPLITTSISILIGILLYFFYVRRRINEGIAGPPNQKI
jgi:amino acid transporter